MIRRAVVLVVFLGLIVALVSGVKALLGEEPSKAASTAPEVSTPTTVPDDPAATTETSADEATSTTAPDTTVADAGSVPTAADPARIYLAGDSDAGTFAPFLERQLESTGVTKLTVDYKVSSGLARPDFFDWPARLHEQIPVVSPDIVVVTFGGNDGQPIHGLDKNVDTPEWRAEYGKRVSAVMDYLSQDGRTLIWVGIPNAGSPNLTARLEIQNEVVKEQLATHPNVVFVDAWDRFTGIDGGYASYVVDPRDGESKPVRGGDGFHLNTKGAEILANDISQAVLSELRKRGAGI
jgi:uncharacterized protein